MGGDEVVSMLWYRKHEMTFLIILVYSVLHEQGEKGLLFSESFVKNYCSTCASLKFIS